MKPDTLDVIEKIAQLILFESVDTAVSMKPLTAVEIVLTVAETAVLIPSTND